MRLAILLVSVGMLNAQYFPAGGSSNAATPPVGGITWSGINPTFPGNVTVGTTVARVLVTALGTGQIGLALGPNEPDLSCCNGNATSFSITGNEGANNPSNYVFAGGYPTVNYYQSRGTLTAPIASEDQDTMWASDSLYYHGGTYEYGTSSYWNVEEDLGGGGNYNGYIYQSAMHHGGSKIASRLSGASNTFCLGETPGGFDLIPCQIGFTPISAGVGEFNNGIDSSLSGGAVARLNMLGVATKPVAVESLPACDATTAGLRMGVTDSNAASFTLGIGAVVAAGGSTKVPVYCDGTNWHIG